MTESIIIFTVIFGIVGFVGMVLFGGGNVVKTRIDTVSVRTSPENVRRGQKSGEAANRAALDNLREREKASKNRALIPLLTRKIQQAGYAFSPQVFLLASGALFLVLALIFSLYINIGGLVVSLGASLVFSGVLPMVYLNTAIKRRQVQFLRTLPDALDLMVRGVKSGLPLNESIQAVATEISGPVGVEFSNILDKLVVGVTLEEVLERLYYRMPLAEVNFMRIILTIQHSAGGNISEALNNLSSVLRARAIMKEKIAAITSEARASSVIIGSLPLVMAALMMLTSPGYLDPLFQTPTGHKVLTGAAIMFGLGIFTLVRMMQIKQ